jgi:hypothetical protein
MRAESLQSVELRDIFKAIARGEDIVPFFPKKIQKDLVKRGDLAIAEISGRDSIAAALKLIKEGKETEILPVADDVPPQYGNMNEAFSPIFWLQKEAKKHGAKVHDLVIVKEHELYSTLTAKYSREMIKRYGFYTPCMPCHLYFHSIRAVLITALGGTRVIGGERDSHDGKMKPSQVPTAIDYYIKAVKELGGELILPLRNIDKTQDIIDFTYEENTQLSCMFKRTFKDLSESIMRDETRIKKFFEEFAMPLNLKLMKELTTNENVDVIKTADEFVAKLNGT